MPSAESSVVTEPTRRRGELGLTIAVLGTLVAALLPVLRVASPGWWLLGSVVLASLVLGAGYIARRYRLPAVAVSLIEAAVWAAFMTAVFLNQTAHPVDHPDSREPARSAADRQSGGRGDQPRRRPTR